MSKTNSDFEVEQKLWAEFMDALNDCVTDSSDDNINKMVGHQTRLKKFFECREAKLNALEDFDDSDDSEIIDDLKENIDLKVVEEKLSTNERMNNLARNIEYNQALLNSGYGNKDLLKKKIEADKKKYDALNDFFQTGDRTLKNDIEVYKEFQGYNVDKAIEEWEKYIKTLNEGYIPPETEEFQPYIK